MHGTEALRIASEPRGDHERKGHGEDRAGILPRAVRGDGPAVLLDEMTDDREAEAQPAVGATDRAVGLPETLEDVRQELCRDALPGVADGELEMGVDTRQPD